MVFEKKLYIPASRRNSVFATSTSTNEVQEQLLITDNRKSIPGHLESYWAEGGHIR